MKRKKTIENCVSSKVSKNDQVPMLLDEIWSSIFIYTLYDIQTFTKTWCVIRSTCKIWNHAMDMRQFRFYDKDIIRHCFLLSIRCNRGDWVNHFIQNGLICADFE